MSSYTIDSMDFHACFLLFYFCLSKSAAGQSLFRYFFVVYSYLDVFLLLLLLSCFVRQIKRRAKAGRWLKNVFAVDWSKFAWLLVYFFMIIIIIIIAITVVVLFLFFPEE